MKQLFIILAIASVLRLVNLGSIPVGFNDDEAAFGYNAYSIVQTGRDEWGRLLPFPAFESFGDWKLVGYLYPTVLTTTMFGMNEFSTRLPSALFGIAAVYATYLLTKELFDKRIALTAAFLLAISPWHVIASRNAFESDLLVATIAFSTFFFLKSLNDKKYLYFSSLGFLYSLYIYRSSWLFLPLFIACLLLIYRREVAKFKKTLVKVAVLSAVLLLPLVPVVLTFQGQSRFLQESFLSGVSRSGIDNRINEVRGACQVRTPAAFCALAYNKPLIFLETYIQNYGRNLSFSTFFENASPTGFQSFMTRSVFYLFEFPLLVLGIVLLFKKNNKAARLLLIWVLLTPIGAAVTGAGNYGRINLIMPAPQIISAFSAVWLILMFKKPRFRLAALTVATIIISVSTFKFITDAFFAEPYYVSRFQRYGYKELFTYLKEKENEYDTFYISKSIDNSHQYIQYAYFSNLDPSTFQKEAIRPKTAGGWVDFAQIGKYKFTESAPQLEKLDSHALIVTGEHDIGREPIHVIRDLHSDIVFEIHETE